MDRSFSPARLDVRAFAEDAATLAGTTRVGEHPRLAAEAGGHADDRGVQWRATGELRNPRHVQPQVWLHLQAEVVLPMTCQRCLEPVEVPVTVERSFRFVADEQTAAAQDDEAEEDLLVTSRAFDLPGLVEDELLMALPVVPRHDTCPQPVALSAADPDFDNAVPEHPFARLKGLRSGGG